MFSKKYGRGTAAQKSWGKLPGEATIGLALVCVEVCEEGEEDIHQLQGKKLE